jgi:hypothetical protein
MVSERRPGLINQAQFVCGERINMNNQGSLLMKRRGTRVRAESWRNLA